MYDNLKEAIEVKTKLLWKNLVYKIKVLDNTILWKELEISFLKKALVKNKQKPVNKSEILWKKTITIDSTTIEWEFYFALAKDFYTYIWKDLDIKLSLDLKLKNKMFFDFHNSYDIVIDNHIIYIDTDKEHKNFTNFRDKTNYKKIYSLFDINTKQKIKNYFYIIALISIISFIYVFYILFFGKSLVYNIWWETKNIIFYPLIIPFIFILFILFKINFFFSNIITFKSKEIQWTLIKWEKYNLKDFLSWISKLDMDNTTIKIIAYNIEKWQEKIIKKYRDSEWWYRTKEVEESFFNYINHQIIFEKEISFIPAWEPIEKYLSENIVFDKVFDNLFKPQLSFWTHSIDMNCEIKLISDTFYDESIIIPKNKFF